MIKSQFSYCPLIWTFSGRQSNNLINKVHERSLRLIKNNQNNSFETLLQNNKDITVHQRNFLSLTIPSTSVYDNFFLFTKVAVASACLNCRISLLALSDVV